MDTSVKLSSIDSEYAKRRKKHLALINQLRAIGAQADLDLPRVAVIGNQSAGKSSLVEAISGITVPRDAGTCTRCPMECRLSSSSGAWQCQVSIRWEFDKDDNAKDEVHEVPFGGLITSKADVELALRRAQTAVLNPHIPSSKYSALSLEDLRKEPPNKLLFSRNVVCVDLTGPELTDLAFIDLPGIIQNADSHIVRLVEDLVLSHIEGNCLILVTLPMSDDIENQKAARLAKQVDPSGLRTIGVMTKPDTLSAGATKARDLWLEVIEGRRFPLRHGYYCTRQPDDEERANGITTSQARAAEQEFFSKTLPWSRSAQQNRFGTNHLISSLSKLLSQVIDDTLPKLQGEVMSQLTTCRDRLSLLPPVIATEPSAYVLNMVTMFCQEVQLHVRGDSRAAGLVQQNRRTYAEYKRDIRATAPKFLPFTDSPEVGGDIDQYLDLNDDNVGDSDSDAEESSSQAPASGEYMYLEDVKRHIERSLTRELPGNVPYNAKIGLIQESQHDWQRDSEKCFEAISKSLEGTVSRLINVKFKRYETLKSRMMHVSLELLRERYSATSQVITEKLAFEQTPYTQNGHYLQQTKDRYLAKYKDARAGGRSDDMAPPKKRTRRSSEKIARAQGTSAATPSIFDFSKMPGTSSSSVPATPGRPSSAVSPQKAPAALLHSPRNPAAKSPFAFGVTSLPGGSGAAHPQNVAAAMPQQQQQKEKDTVNQFGKRPIDKTEEEIRAIQNRISADLASLGFLGVTPDDFGKLNPPDIYEREMEVMAEVRAYFHVSYKRVIDDIPMTIDNMFLFAFADQLQSHLIEKLGLGSPNARLRCTGYLAEDPAVVAEREELIGRQKRLEAVQTELYNFGL